MKRNIMLTSLITFSNFCFSSQSPNVTLHDAYISLDIPEPINSNIALLRTSLATKAELLPVELTLSGSSGIGPVPKGTDISLIKEAVDSLAQNFYPFEVELDEIKNFQNSGIFYLSPKHKSTFDLMHNQLKRFPKIYTESRFAYTPHITIRNSETIDPETKNSILTMSFPRSKFIISSISVYELDKETYSAVKIYQKTLTKK